MPIAYKIMKKDENGQLTSMFIVPDHPCFKIYKVNEINEEGFAFDSLIAAEKFLKEQTKNVKNKKELWEIEYQIKNKSKFRLDPIFFYTLDFWGQTQSQLGKKTSNMKNILRVASDRCKCPMFPKAIHVQQFKLIRKIEEA